MTTAPLPQVTYVTSRWGEPTQTFVRREARALSDLGVDVTALSLKQPCATTSRVPVTRLTPVGVLRGVAVALWRSPRVVVSTLSTVVRRSSIRNTAPQFAAACTGLAWASRSDLLRGHLHCHFGWVGATAAWAASRLSGVPFSVTLHAFDIHTVRLQDRFTAVPLRAASRRFCISAADAAIVAERIGADVEVSRMGVPSDWVQTPLRRAAQGERSAERIVSVGSLVPKKGHDDAIRAVARTPGWVLEVIGEGPERATLETLIAELGVGDRVRLTGSLPEDQIRERLGDAALFLLACRVTPGGDRDGIPVALMEAMACGAPVVTTSVGGIAELVEGAGLLVPADDPAALDTALSELESVERRDQLARSAQDRIIGAWTCERSAELLLGRIVG